MGRPGQTDSAIPRNKAIIHAVIPALAFLLGGKTSSYVLLSTGLVMTLSVALGPRYSLFGIIVRKLRSRLGAKPGKVEEAAPHVFAEAVGAAFLLGASAAYATGRTTLGAGLALIVVALATLNAAAGICVGCQAYLLFRRLRGGGVSA